MTALRAATGAPTRSRSPRRIGSVIRLHFTNPAALIITPLIVIAVYVVLNIGIWGAISIAAASPGARTRIASGLSHAGAPIYVFAYMGVVAVMAMNGMFRYAQALGATRRDYYLGTSAVFGILTVGYTVLFSALAVVEQLTDGWGFGGRMFTPDDLGVGWGERTAVTVGLFLLAFFVGSLFGTIYVRWRRNGLMIAIGIVLLAGVLVAVVVALLDAQDALFGWIGANAPLGLALWSLVPTVVSAVIGFLVLRRTTPAT